MSTHRYHLTREGMRGEGHVLFVTLAPTIDDDRLIARCHTLAFNWGFDSMEIVNLFSLVVPNERALEGQVERLANPEEITAWAQALRADPDLVVGAWGTSEDSPKWLQESVAGRVQDLIGLLAEYEKELTCLGATRSGQPIHPLFVHPSIDRIEIWEPVW